MNKLKFAIFCLFLQICFLLYCTDANKSTQATIKRSTDNLERGYIIPQYRLINTRSYTKNHHIDSVVASEKLAVHGKAQDELHWGYTEVSGIYPPFKWSLHYPVCSGLHQSPIPLVAESRKLMGRYDEPLNRKISDVNGVINGKILNNGHSFEVEIDSERSSMIITGGPLKNRQYKLKQFHFHLSCDDHLPGSEHSLDGDRFLGELHMVFWNKDYSSFKEAMDKPDGLAVLGYFIRSGNGSNPATSLLNSYVKDIIAPGSSEPLTSGLNLYDLIPSLKDGLEGDSYVTYSGSLTTPPCSESVTWSVFTEPIKIPSVDISSWRQLKGNKGQWLCNNARPLQSPDNIITHFVNQR